MRKIVVIGPESTGKSTLCAQLADHYQCKWVHEFAREYLEDHGALYTYEDLWKIAEGQMQLEDTVTAAAIADKDKFLFIDTNLYVTKIWSEFVFGKCDPRILKEIALREYDLYLLCNTDLPWTPDPLRELPDISLRQKVYTMYKETLINQPVSWIEISGNNEQRFQIAVKGLDNFYSCLK